MRLGGIAAVGFAQKHRDTPVMRETANQESFTQRSRFVDQEGPCGGVLPGKSWQLRGEGRAIYWLEVIQVYVNVMC